MIDSIDDFEGPESDASDLAFEELEEEVAGEESEEAPEPARGNRRETRRSTAHVPGPRRKPRYAAIVRVPVAEEVNEEEEIDVGAATAEPESVSDESLSSDSGHEAPQQGLEKPISLGSVDG